MDISVVNFMVYFGHALGGEMLSLLLLMVCYISILSLWRYFGISGLYLYNTLAIVVANIQVLKLTDFILSPEPIALGTLLFATTFLVSDIITENRGVKAAMEGVRIAFVAQILITVLMLITIAYPITETMEEMSVQASLETLFSPSLRILFASLISFYISQWMDVKIFQYMKQNMAKKKIWFRLNVSSLVSGLVDNIIFSTLAWVVLSSDPVTLRSLIFVYILGTYGARVVVSVTSTPIIYLTKKINVQ